MVEVGEEVGVGGEDGAEESTDLVDNGASI